MSDKLHTSLATAITIATGLITYALAPGGPANGHPQAITYLQFALAGLGLMGTLLVKPLTGSSDPAKSNDAAPPSPPPPAPGPKLNTFLPFLLMASLLASGCAGWPIFKNCEKPVLANATQSSLVSELITDALSDNYMGALLDLGGKIGLPTLDCMAKALYADAQANSTLAPLVARLKAYLDARTAAGASLECKPGPKPYVTVIASPHDELAWFADGPDMAAIAHNPTGRRIVGRVECRAMDSTYASSLPVTLEPGEEKAIGFVQVMNRDVHAEPCRIVE